ncbi:MAG: heavy metal translocating P-type ATPase metal-binding domain-containing protein [Campylobacter sp.]|uniref:heavy metal translocating P-type ATPase n=1 Tax=Campylobacter sp. TaxID=205 RepID=UPI0029731EA7|nr:heavy metal translocating P-type ATPase metal-binding domain-containing protein [Campylobacter sp.]MDD7600673.1 heavy metal translocating P-type ATPase metal-binding domain-containing protein [Campylobacteraceae bacterium]MDY5887759.1 heavy metal translocating P-type ATPase metal-binding domain-containing protein [Campylobacter sp.]
MFVCKHCAGHFEAEAVIDANGNEFCCNGCKNVYAYLKSQGLSEFYSKLKKGEQNLAKPSSKHFDKQSAGSMFSKLLRRDENSPFICELEVLISGIHCPACIWLNEKALSNLEGVLELNISATTSKARVLFDERKTALEEILNLIIAIGYDPKPFNAIKSAKNSLSREHYARLIVALACSMNIMWVAIAVYSGYFEGLSAGAKKILHFAEFVLASPPVFYTASVFYRSALSSLKLRQISMDVNVSLGILSVYFYSVYAMLSGSEQVYFDSACMLVTFIFAGKFLQTKATQKAARELENISSLFVEQVMSVKNNSRIPSISEFKPCDVSEVKSGDFVLLRSGERAMIDGVVLSGEASVDNSSINGESVPVGISKDDALLSGALCAEGSVIYKATSSFQGSFLNKLSKLLSNASFARAQIEELANKISSHFGWAILGLCVVSFVFWSVANISAWSGANAFGIAISVLVIACPCALSLATPIATLVAMGTATKRSIVFKDAKVLETLAKCDIIAFDKTGTLSKANLKVLKGQRFLPFDDGALLALASASTHPISKAVASYILENALSPFSQDALENIQNIAGKGITATYKGIKIAGGSAAFIESMAFIESKAFVKSLGASLADDSSSSEYYFMYDGKLVARFFLGDELREGAKASIKELKKMGLKVLMLSGDKQIVASKVASELGIDKSHGELNPEQKALLIKELQKSANVVMVGDGINDILALKSANVGIAMGSGASVSVGISDVVLLRDELSDLVFALRLAKKTFKVIKENLFISLVYNALSIPLAMAGFIIPLFAAISMSFSSLLVVLNSLRLKGQL